MRHSFPRLDARQSTSAPWCESPRHDTGGHPHVATTDSTAFDVPPTPAAHFLLAADRSRPSLSRARPARRPIDRALSLALPSRFRSALRAAFADATCGAARRNIRRPLIFSRPPRAKTRICRRGERRRAARHRRGDDPRREIAVLRSSAATGTNFARRGELLRRRAPRLRMRRPVRARHLALQWAIVLAAPHRRAFIAQD